LPENKRTLVIPKFTNPDAQPCIYSSQQLLCDSMKNRIELPSKGWWNMEFCAFLRKRNKFKNCELGVKWTKNEMTKMISEALSGRRCYVLY